MAKVVLVDSLSRDSVHDELYKEGLSDKDAERLAKGYNDRRSRGSLRLAVVKEDNYELK